MLKPLFKINFKERKEKESIMKFINRMIVVYIICWISFTILFAYFGGISGLISGIVFGSLTFGWILFLRNYMLKIIKKAEDRG